MADPAKEATMPRPEDLEGKKFYPAGDLPPEPEDEEVIEDEGHADDPGDNSQAGQADDKAGEEGTPNWEERYKQLEKKLGEQGNELGTMRQQNQELQQALQQMQQTQTPEGQEQAQDLQTRLQDIRKQLDDGDLSPDEAMFATANVVAQMSRMEAEQIAEQRLQKFQQNSQAEQILNQFHRDNPDFEELRQTGTLEEVKKQLPGLHDDFSAYYAYKAQVAADEGYKRGKEEMEKLASGDAAAGKVLSKPGQTIRQKNQKPLTSPKDIQNSMLERLRAARGG
jgi:small-conductance mechanosensitive channel